MTLAQHGDLLSILSFILGPGPQGGQPLALFLPVSAQSSYTASFLGVPRLWSHLSSLELPSGKAFEAMEGLSGAEELDGMQRSGMR